LFTAYSIKDIIAIQNDSLMKTTYSIAAIAMFAVILGMSALAPAMAVKMDKIDVCHFSEEKIEIDADGFETVIPAEWKVINISGNAEKAHVGKHTDNVEFDVLVSDDPESIDTITEEVCLARNVVAEQEPDVLVTETKA
jgi:hypothetical protein